MSGENGMKWGVCKRVALLAGLAVAVSGLTAVPARADASVTREPPKVAAGYYHSLVVKDDGTLWAWGDNDDGEVGDGTRVTRRSPVKVMSDVATVAAGNTHSLAVKTDGSLWAWGWNRIGALGDGTYWNTRTKPIRVKGMDKDVVMVAAGSWHSLALKSDGSLWAWGDNEYGQLGDGTNYMRVEPVRIVNSGVVWVDTSGDSSFYVTEDGSVYGFGFNEWGQLGLGDTDDRSLPAKVGISNVAVVTAGYGHTLALKNDNTLWGWGGNDFGQLGIPGLEDRLLPESLGTRLYSTIAAGGASSAGVGLGTNELYAWGDNEFGKLGDGTIYDRFSPVMVGEQIRTVAVSIAGEGFTLRVGLDGLLKSAGHNGFGQLGDGTKTHRRSPVIVMQMGPGAVSGVKSVAKLYLVAGKSKVLPSEVYPYDALLQDVTWKSANTSVATVDANGKVTAKAKAAGKSTTITVMTVDGKFTASCKVYVVKKSAAVKSFKVPASNATGLVVGKTMQVKPTSLKPAKATGVVAVYASSDESVAVVDTMGVITGVSAGKATITVKAGAKTKKFVFTVGTVAPTKITLNKKTASVKKGKKLALEVVAWTPAEADPQTVIWKTSNKKIATVNSEGVVTGKKKGKVTITAVTWNGKTVKCVVTVK